jgi:hypothetical protein
LGSIEDSVFDELPDMYNESTCLYNGVFPDFGGSDCVQFADVLPDEVVDELDPAEVAKARWEEIQELERRVYEVVDIDEAWQKTGKPPIGVRWVDVKKKEGMYRSRLVAKDFAPRSKNNDDAEGLYAAMPPLELVKVLISRAARCGEKVMLIDIKRLTCTLRLRGMYSLICLLRGPPQGNVLDSNSHFMGCGWRRRIGSGRTALL